MRMKASLERRKTKR